MLAAAVPNDTPSHICQVKARRKFFDAGYYNLVADQIGSIITDAYTSCNEVGSMSALSILNPVRQAWVCRALYE